MVKFSHNLDVIKTKIVSLSKELYLVVSITSPRFGSVNTTLNDPVCLQGEVENYFQSIDLSLRFPCNDLTLG